MGEPPGKVRIIGGRWRGRQIPVPKFERVRPTPARARETLFNWLMPHIQQAVCLDLFSGSGILGFEALSRGADFVTFVEANKKAVSHLFKMQEVLECYDSVKAIEAKLPLVHPNKIKRQPCDIVFIDPPYHTDLIEQSLAWLIDNNLLANEALIYIESAIDQTLAPLPETLKVLKDKVASKVRYQLLEFVESATSG